MHFLTVRLHNAVLSPISRGPWCCKRGGSQCDGCSEFEGLEVGISWAEAGRSVQQMKLEEETCGLGGTVDEGCRQFDIIQLTPSLHLGQ